jgi:hypothetical protein
VRLVGLIFGFLAATALADGPSLSTVSVEQRLRERCPALDAPCTASALNSMWKSADTASRSAILSALRRSSAPSMSAFLESAYRGERNRVLRLAILDLLLSKHAGEDLAFIIQLLPDCSIAGREGDRVCLVVLNHLQFSVPIEYDFDMRAFLASRRTREALAERYQSWLRAGSPPVFDRGCECFARAVTSAQQADAHARWYLELRKAQWSHVHGS